MDFEVTATTDEALYRAHIRDAIRFAHLLTGDGRLAEDLAHDAFLRCAPKVGSLASPDRFRSYLRRSIVRGVQMRVRSAASEQRRIERVARELPPSGDPGASAADRVDLARLVGALPIRQRAVIVLRYWGDLSEAEIARTLRCRPGTVKSALARGLAAIRVEVGADGGPRG